MFKKINQLDAIGCYGDDPLHALATELLKTEHAYVSKLHLLVRVSYNLMYKFL